MEAVADKEADGCFRVPTFLPSGMRGLKVFLLAMSLIAGLSLISTPVQAEPPAQSTSASDTTALYTRLGQESGIARLVDTAIRRILADTILKPYFKSASPQSIAYARKIAIAHICSESDGPCWSFFNSGMLSMVVELNQPLWQRLRGHVTASLTANKIAGVAATETLEIVDQIGRDLLKSTDSDRKP